MRLGLILSLLGLAGCMEDGTARGCSDGIDNDGDGRIDCADPNCNDRPVCRWGTLPPWETGWGEPDPDPGAYQGPWQVQMITWNCEVSSGEYLYDVTTDGWAEAVYLDIFETGAWDGSNEADVWDEYHPMLNTEFAEDGSWDRWALPLAFADADGDGQADISAQVSGESTLYVCGYHGENELAWMVTMDAGPNGTDCGIWGYDAEAWYNTDQGYSCYVFDS